MYINVLIYNKFLKLAEFYKTVGKSLFTKILQNNLTSLYFKTYTCIILLVKKVNFLLDNLLLFTRIITLSRIESHKFVYERPCTFISTQTIVKIACYVEIYNGLKESYTPETYQNCSSLFTVLCNFNTYQRRLWDDPIFEM